MILYGRNPVREALRGRRSVSRVWATGSAFKAEAWLADAPSPSEVGGQALEELCGSRDHQGVCAETTAYPYVSPDALMDGPDALVIVLDEIQDVQNLGAVCRVAEAAGVAGVVIPQRRAAEVTPAACKASAGAVEHLDIARVRNVADWLTQAKDAGAWVYGAAAGSASVSYTDPDYRGRVALVLGSEGKGLRPRVAGVCDQLIALPQRGRLESLNVATAAAALVYGILQSRDLPLDMGP